MSVTSLGDHCRGNGVKSCPNGALTSPLGEVNAPFETQVSAYSYYIFEQSRNLLCVLIQMKQVDGSDVLFEKVCVVANPGAVQPA